MPTPGICNQIADRKEREDCKKYRGKFAPKSKGKRPRVTKGGPSRPSGGGY
tara:strand:+ start:278 stop:430 length:153 start_codon:yes stop_codon:yes gene_type:complete